MSSHTRLRTARLVVAAVVVTAASGRAFGQLADTPWPTMNHDLQRTGRSPYIGPDEPTEKWRFQMDDLSLSALAIGLDGTIYAGDWDGIVYAVNPDGTERWRFQTTGGTIHSAGATIGADGTIYVGTQGLSDGTVSGLHALDPDGSEKWWFPLGYHLYGAPTIDADGTLYIGTREGLIRAIDPGGDQIWQFGSRDDTYYFAACPALGHDGRLYAAGYLDVWAMFCIDRDGMVVWEEPGYDCFSGASIDSTGVIYTANIGGLLRANEPDGSLRWERNIGLSGGLAAIGVDGTIYAPGANGLHAFSPDGELQWVQPSGYLTRPAVDGEGTIYVGGDASHVLAYCPDGRLKWQFPTVGAVYRAKFAIDSDGTIYVSDEAGILYAIGPGRSSSCPADLDDSGIIDFADLLALLAAWGPCIHHSGCPEDIDDDGIVDFADLLILLAAWGPCE